MRIPRSFQVMGLTYQVKLIPRESWKIEDAWAYVDFDTRVISVMKRDKDATEQSFLHEVIHVVFSSLGHNKLSKDERLVDTCASVLHQILTSAK